MVKIFNDFFRDVNKARYVFDPQGGKYHTGAFVPEKSSPRVDLIPEIVLTYEADKIYHHYKGDSRGFVLNLLVNEKPISKPISGVITEIGPNLEYYKKVREMIEKAKEHHKTNSL